MRLLQLHDDQVTLTNDLTHDLPPYAILSHTWGADSEEVTFQDLSDKRGEHKTGYKKILFCGQQARRDGLQHFWVDTCCIDKTSSAELTEAINSMFRWYRYAKICYVYLSDVSTDATQPSSPWLPQFHRSRWFTRGWTLQELLAPLSVSFFSAEGDCLGDKVSLEMEIHSITKIKIAALRGTPLSQFPTHERMAWFHGRQTTKEEDAAYCLLGIFDVFLPMIYGEGRGNAMSRLLKAVEEKASSPSKLCVTDMAAEIKSLQQRKDSLLADSYKWILGNQQYQEFTEWQSGDTKTLLWIKGDAGKGKTMLLIGIVDELTTQLDTLFDKSHLSYFFCQGTDNRLNTATAILRGLIWMLLRQQKSLMHHLDIFKDLGLTLFEARTAFYNLKKILQCMLEDPALERAYLVIDALDECKKEEPGQQQLLELISEMSAKNNKVKWLVSSRNEREIEAVLEEDPTRARLSLELNAASVAGAVNVYIDYKMSQLAERYQKAYAARNNPKIREKRQRVQGSVAKELRQKADGTFLWVALVFKQIEGCGADKVLERVKQMPSDLHSMYTQMMRQVDIRDDAADCKKVLLAVVNAYRPLHSSELATLAGLSDLAIHEDIVRHCGLLTIKEDDETVYFVHQSAKDYLTQDPSSDLLKIFPLGYAEGHRTIVSRSLEAMSTILKKDVYALQHPGFPITDVENPIPDPLNPIRYACVYWVDHLCEIQEIGDVAAIDVFMKDHFLHWFEALSLIKSTSKGVLALHKLVNLLEVIASQPQLLHLARDMYRFARSFSGIIEQAPLQIYSSALIFSPAHCLTRDHFKSKEPDWITQKPSIEENWSACISTLEGHSARVSSIAFSPDGQHIASGSDDRTIKIWNAESGACISTLEGHSDWVRCIAFSPDGQHIASGSDDGTIKIWNAESGACISTLEGHSAWVRCIAFSPDGQHIASGSDDGTIKIWNAESGACISTLEGHSDWVRCIAFSPDGQHIASGSDDGTIKIWNAESGACISTLEGHSAWVRCIAFSPDGQHIASGSSDGTIKIWNAESGACISTLEGHSAPVSSIAFSPDGQHIASGSDDRTIKIWNAESGACISTLEGHSDWVRCIAFSPDGQHIASGSDDGTIKIWNAESGACISTLEGHSAWVRCIAFSPDGQHIASGSSDGTIKIWNAESGACISTLEGHSAPVSSIAFSPDGQHIASGSDDGTIKIWNAESGACISTLEIGSAVCQLRFDSTGSNLHTDIGMIALESDIAISQPAITFRQLKQCGYGMNSDRSWIVLEGCKLLWLPKDFRPTAFDVLQRTICVGCSSGRVWNIRFDLENQV
ncbi:hypothetical protein M406DRAFT_84049 [Cryphonectria parasitica EP155]|uniref:NACHT domain-containing protein n=1 Tax=Cryphonectria parasitica (strain ATCC 38755 / EP155) TaxID=660469 RepID=A0A9P5CLK3_CRYP1|nr:uncharacterized protein M406DRAFT_84049 [Cryphonectria parasitica EP155]KAF3763158.1 hypothetical protein M406DRAFT_84049 [Cryphonectria parasitica EP155]